MSTTHLKMNKAVKYLVIVLCLPACQCDEPQVTTPLGKVRGTIRTSHGNRKYSVFEGIPFAKPPVGDRRFEAPEPVEPWNGIWEANFRMECVQSFFGNISFVIKADEDCLYINVYVPRETPNSKEKLDVIVHIHGGAYMYGSGHFYTNPQFLMDHDVVFVTFNYRVGILGFLSTEDDVVPGNNGMKDQVLALKWVQQNIASFGGNPDSVTIHGLSAGASAVHFHYFSEMSKGLFHRGFSQSGVALNHWSIQEEPLNKAKILAHAVGCPTAPTRTLVQCLKQRPHQHLIAKVPLFFGHSIMPFAPFAPVVEKGSKPFLKANPFTLLTRGEVHDVPWIASNTAHEGLLTIGLIQNLETIDERWEDLAPFLLDYNYTLPPSQWTNAAQKVKEFYIGQNQQINEDNFLKLVQIFTDRTFITDAEIAVKEQAKVTNSPIYYYIFSYPGDNNDSGTVNHGFDSKFFFGETFSPKGMTPNDYKMVDITLEMLVSFGKTGKPKITGVKWEPIKHEKLTYLDFGGPEPEKIKLHEVEELTPRAFWKSLGFRENENLIVSKDEL